MTAIHLLELDSSFRPNVAQFEPHLQKEGQTKCEWMFPVSIALCHILFINFFTSAKPKNYFAIFQREEVDVVTVMSPIDLTTTVLKP